MELKEGISLVRTKEYIELLGFKDAINGCAVVAFDNDTHDGRKRYIILTKDAMSKEAETLAKKNDSLISSNRDLEDGNSRLKKEINKLGRSESVITTELKSMSVRQFRKWRKSQ